MRRLNKVLLLSGLLAASVSAGAAEPVVGGFTVAAKFGQTCALTATNMVFGTAIPSPVTTDVPATSVLTATCSGGQSYEFLLGLGSGVGTACAMRKMTYQVGAPLLNYNLYLEAAHTTIWSNEKTGSCGSIPAAVVGNGAAQTVTVYGNIPGTPSQSPLSGVSYNDSIIVTMNLL